MAQAKKPALTLVEIAKKGQGLVPGVTDTVAPVKLGIIYSQEMEEKVGRAKIDKDFEKKTIQTIRGVGYVFQAD